jgi:hypothetical protein
MVQGWRNVGVDCGSAVPNRCRAFLSRLGLPLPGHIHRIVHQHRVSLSSPGNLSRSLYRHCPPSPTKLSSDLNSAKSFLYISASILIFPLQPSHTLVPERAPRLYTFHSVPSPACASREWRFLRTSILPSQHINAGNVRKRGKCPPFITSSIGK